MNGIELFVLGRTLMKLGERALPAEEVGDHAASTRTVLIVVNDLRDHPGSAVGEIAVRTGLPQSAVSAAVARLREAGAVVTEPDPRDRRRSLVHPRVSERVQEVRAVSVDATLAEVLPDDTALAEVCSALETLARHLTPRSPDR
ncbi:helix-turn-helix domain-containing protein [Streptosporangium sp. NPDC020072]|uniref:MarR family transcriptional regulator n=1 Tax=Streptosporangium sp. NPDC020072 TaxID=3154788 RepID=UPI0034122652